MTGDTALDAGETVSQCPLPSSGQPVLGELSPPLRGAGENQADDEVRAPYKNWIQNSYPGHLWESGRVTWMLGPWPS